MSKPNLDRDIPQSACQEYLAKIGDDKRIDKPNLAFVGIVLGYADDDGKGIVVSTSSAHWEGISRKLLFGIAADNAKD
jgi:hypothetical protein